MFASGCSILVGVGLGLCASWLFKHTDLKRYPNLETSLLLCFCYLCYAVAEAIELSGIMALFFQGIVLSHYNAYNLSIVAHVASEQIFSTFATLTETIVFVYMGMGVFTGGFQNWDLTFSIVAFVSCVIGRAMNIFPLSLVANFYRDKSNKITPKTQVVLWFAGLRGAIAFALSKNMPGPHKEIYATATLTICIVTTVFCGGFTERVLTVFELREEFKPMLSCGTDPEDDNLDLNSLTYKPPVPEKRETRLMRRKRRITEGITGVWHRFDDQFLKIHFGGRHMLTEERDQNVLRSINDSNDDSFHINGTDEDGTSWSENYEMENMNGSRMGETAKANMNGTRNQLKDIKDEMISLTSLFDDEQ